MYRLITLLATSTALVGCMTTPVSAPAPVAVAASAAPAAEFGSYGFDATGMDVSIQPGDNFFEYANGAWAKTTPIPADMSSYGMFTRLTDVSRQRTRAIIEEQARNPASKIGVAYSGFLDTAAIETKGLAPFQPWLDEIRGIQSQSQYAAVAAKAHRMNIGSPIGLSVGPDDRNPDRYIATLGQGGIGLPDRDYYLGADARMAEIRAEYLAHLANVLTLAGEADAAARAQAIFDFETRIARAHWNRLDSRDATKIYNPLTRAQFVALTEGYDLSTFLSGVGLGSADEMLAAQPSAVQAIARLVSAAPLAVLKDQLLVRSLDRYALVLPTAFDKEQFAFYGTTLGGAPEQEARWKRAVDFTTGALADDVSQIYVARHFPPETKAAADALVNDIVEAMSRRIDGLAWMAPETKVQARAKLANFTAKICYPDHWQDYATLEIRRGDALGNALRAAEWGHADSLLKLAGPVRKWEWGMTPMRVSAYVNYGMLEVVFPAAILQPPFFDPAADPAVNFGGIGAIIAHEMSHHFYDQGAQYNERGQLADWWTPDDVIAFETASKGLVDQYDAYEIFPGASVNGAVTLGENIGDLAGLTISYDAYQHSLNGASAPVIEGATGDQRFFLGWAQVWRRNYREANLRQRLITDPQSPAPQRVSVVRNLDAWYDAHRVLPGQKLYLEPAGRVRLW